MRNVNGAVHAIKTKNEAGFILTMRNVNKMEGTEKQVAWAVLY